MPKTGAVIGIAAAVLTRQDSAAGADRSGCGGSRQGLRYCAHQQTHAESVEVPVIGTDLQGQA